MNYLFKLSNRGKEFLRVKFYLVVFFALCYYLNDYILSYYPDFSEKYLLDTQNYKNIEEKNLVKPILTYIWFSLMTQTTVGYTIHFSNYTDLKKFNEIRSVPFKIINIAQLITVFGSASFLF